MFIDRIFILLIALCVIIGVIDHSRVRVHVDEIHGTVKATLGNEEWVCPCSLIK